MKIKAILGTAITRVFCVFGTHDGWLDTADCILELDGNLLIGFPTGFDDEIWVRELPENAERLFRYGYDRDVIGCKIVDFIWYEDEVDPAYFLLDNGAIITETRMSPHGTGMAGLNFYESIADLAATKGEGFKRLSDSGNET